MVALWCAGSASAAPPASTSSLVRVGDAIAQVNGREVLLANGEIVHRWQVSPQNQVSTTELLDPQIGRNWSVAHSPEFSMLVDSVPTSSDQIWRLLNVTARHARGGGVELEFRYALGLLELDRTWTLYPGSAVEGVSSRLINPTPAIYRVGRYSLAELTSRASAVATVNTFHGGSDWRQDFRVSRTDAGPFDAEGEIAQFQSPGGGGWFLVGQRRSGAMSRVGRDPNGRSWVGVDNARDVLDAGPLLSSPPNYNRIENPVWPAPIRQRTLLPLGTLDLGRAYLGVYHGGNQQAAAAFVNDFATHEMASFARSVDLNTFHPWGHGSGLSDANLRPQAAIFKTLHGELFMLDDQWQGKSAGDWQWDTARFPIHSPDGVPDFVKYVHSLGLSLGLWMSPAEFNPKSVTYRTHPTWACTPIGDVTAQIPDDSGLGVWDMTNPSLRAHLTQAVDRLIAQDGVREFKFDYVTWVDCPPHDYLDYEDAYVGWLHQLQLRHPHVTFELDETNDQRLWAVRSVALGPSWFDNGHLQGSTYPARLLHDVWSSAPWLPPSTLGFGTYDGTAQPPYSPDYLMPIGLLGHLTFWTDLTKLSSTERTQTQWWTRWYERHRGALSGLVYEDTSTDPIDGRSWVALQPWRRRHGYLFVFRQDNATATQTIALQGLDSTTRYSLINVRTGQPIGSFSGQQLEQGLAVSLPSIYSAGVISVVPTRQRR
jgi:hypothetical protein